MSQELYPFVFKPILKHRIWGGGKLATVLGKEIRDNRTGESWELSGVEGDVSIIANGTMEELSLNELLEQFPQQVLGSDVYNRFGKQFPLLFKFIDAREDLSIQVHPDDKLAKERHNSFGKTEMWYIMDADPGASIIVGFKKNTNSEDYLENLENNTLPQILDRRPVSAGDVFFLETGTVHAIGAGILLAEIQQTSDITYRIYDWDRKDESGKGRQLHVDEALEAMNYEVSTAARTYSKDPNTANPVVDCPFFTTNFIPLDGRYEPHCPRGSFAVYMCVEGSFSIRANEVDYIFTQGDTVLVPAMLNREPLSGNAKLLQIYIS